MQIKRILCSILALCMVLSWIPMFAGAAEIPGISTLAAAPQAEEEWPFHDWEWEVLKIVNRERHTSGMDPVTGFSLIQEACDIRAVELVELFSHTRPDDSSCFTVFDEVGIDRWSGGENIAAGYDSPEDVMYGWMNSPGHRANILTEDFTHMGVGYHYIKSSYYRHHWVQLFCNHGYERYTSASLVFPNGQVFEPGQSIEAMDLYIELENDIYGTCYLPVLEEYVTGYDPNVSTDQTITVSVMGISGEFTLYSSLTVPEKPYKIANVVSGVHVYWKAVPGAQKYGVWRSETGKDGTYKWLANPTVPHFTDTKAESGKTYYYKVTAMWNGTHTDKSEAIGITYVSTPDITSRSNTAAGVQLGWEKIAGATGYAIYRKSYSGSDAWARIGTIEGNETFTWTDTSVKNNNGEVYKYTIRALAGSNMKTLSGCRNAGRTMVRLSSQYIKSIESPDATSVKLSWSTSSRVTGYEVRFMVDGEVYKTFTVGNYKTGTKTFKDLEAGQTYTVQVRAYKKVDGVGSFYSDWSKPWNVTT